MLTEQLLGSLERMKRHLYSFGSFELDIVEQTLRRNGEPLPLKPKVFALLAVLVENSGRLVSKDELMKQVWNDTVVEEGNLAVSVVKLRQALGEARNDRRYIETVPRRGYRFVAPVTQSQSEGNHVASPTSVAVTSVVGVGVIKATIGVLPFKFIGRRGDQYLGLGLADALITKLSNLRHVTVRPTSAILKYNGRHDPILAGRELRAEWVLDGSVQKADGRIRVTVQLLNTDDGLLQWAEKFDEKFTNIFEVEDLISQQVANALAPKLTGTERKLLAKRYTDNTDAYESYLKGRYFLDKRTTEGCKKAIAHFNQAIATDANYALAYAGLAHSYIILGGYKLLPSEDYYLHAERAILRALEIDRELAETHAALGSLRTRQWDWLSAEHELKKAIGLNPNYALAHSAYAAYLGIIGRPREALLEIKKAQDIDPLSLPLNAMKGSLLYLARRYDEAIEQLHRTLALDADFAAAHFCLGCVYEAQGRYDEAVTANQRARTGLRDIQELAASIGRIDALSGRRDKALEALARLSRVSRNRNVQPYSIALIYSALGDRNEAFQWLETAYAQHDEDLFLLKVDPRLDRLREDSRFAVLLQRIGLQNPTH